MDVDFDVTFVAYLSACKRFMIVGDFHLINISIEGKLVGNTQDIVPHSNITVSPRGTDMVVIGLDKTEVTVFDLSHMEEKVCKSTSIDLVPGAVVENSTYTQDGSRFALLTSEDDAVHLYSTTSGTCLASCKASALNTFLETPEPGLLIGWNKTSGEIQAWNLSDANIELKNSLQVQRDTDFIMTTKHGHVVAVAQLKTSLCIHIYDLKSDKCLFEGTVPMDFPTVTARIVEDDSTLILVPSGAIENFKPILVYPNHLLRAILSSDNASLDMIQMNGKGNSNIFTTSQDSAQMKSGPKKSKLCAIL